MNEFNKFAKSEGISSATLQAYSKYINTQVYAMTPNIIEERQLNAVAMDVFSRLMMDRIIYLGTEVDNVSANIIGAQMLFLESTDPSRDIFLYINSPGGSVYDGMAIYDIMQYVKPDVSTICAGMAASMGAVLLSGGTKGKRYALPNSRIMIHQPLGGARGQATDILITAKQIEMLRAELYTILAENCSQPYDKIHADCERDYWMRASEAAEYGIIDEVLIRK